MHHVFVFAGPNSLVLHTAAGLGPSLIAHLDHYWIREDLAFHDRSDEWGEVILAGPQAVGIIESLIGRPSPPAPLPKGEGSYLANCDLTWNGRPLMVRRWRERGFDSFHLAAGADQIGPLWRALRELGATACGMRALEAIRIEEGFPVIGVDITEKNLPQEVGRNEKAISFTKGCYLGQEIVARIDSRGAVAKVLSRSALPRVDRSAGRRRRVAAARASPRDRLLRPHIRPVSRRACALALRSPPCSTSRAWCSIRLAGRQRWSSCR